MMMALNLHLQNLPEQADNLDIRRFFGGFDIPKGGVKIIGGPTGDAFIAFHTQRELLRALERDRGLLLGQPVRLLLTESEDINKALTKAGHEMDEHYSNSGAYSGDRSRQSRRDNAGHSHHTGAYESDVRRRRRSSSGSDSGGGAKRRRRSDSGRHHHSPLGRGGQLVDMHSDISSDEGSMTTATRRQAAEPSSNPIHYSGSQQCVSDGGVGYVQASNIPITTTARDLREFFKGYEVADGGIILKVNNDDPDTLIANVKFVHMKDAVNVECTRNGMKLQGKIIALNLITELEFDGKLSSSSPQVMSVHQASVQSVQPNEAPYQYQQASTSQQVPEHQQPIAHAQGGYSALPLPQSQLQSYPPPQPTHWNAQSNPSYPNPSQAAVHPNTPQYHPSYHQVPMAQNSHPPQHQIPSNPLQYPSYQQPPVQQQYSPHPVQPPYQPTSQHPLQQNPAQQYPPPANQAQPPFYQTQPQHTQPQAPFYNSEPQPPYNQSQPHLPYPPNQPQPTFSHNQPQPPSQQNQPQPCYQSNQHVPPFNQNQGQPPFHPNSQRHYMHPTPYTPNPNQGQQLSHPNQGQGSFHPNQQVHSPQQNQFKRNEHRHSNQPYQNDQRPVFPHSLSQFDPNYISEHVYTLIHLKGMFTANEVWQWVGGNSGPCTGVIIVAADGAYMACLAFSSEELRAAAEHTLKGLNYHANSFGKSRMLITLAKHAYDRRSMYETTDRGDREMNPQQRFTLSKIVPTPKQKDIRAKPIDLLEPAVMADLYYLKVNDPVKQYPEATTASKVWKVFGGPQGPCIGVILAYNGKGQSIAILAYKHINDRNEVQRVKRWPRYQPDGWWSKCSGTNMICILANLCHQEYIMSVSTDSGDNNTITAEQKRRLLATLPGNYQAFEDRGESRLGEGASRKMSIRPNDRAIEGVMHVRTLVEKCKSESEKGKRTHGDEKSDSGKDKHSSHSRSGKDKKAKSSTEKGIGKKTSTGKKTDLAKNKEARSEKKTDSAKDREASSVKKTESLKDEKTDTGKKTDSTKDKEASSVKKTDSAKDKAASSVKKTDSPKDKATSSVKKTDSPKDKATSSVKKTGSPRDKTASSVKKVESLKDEKADTGKKTDSTKDKEASSGNKTESLKDEKADTGKKTGSTKSKEAGSLKKTDLAKDKEASCGKKMEALKDEKADTGKKMESLKDEKADTGKKMESLKDEKANSGKKTESLKDENADTGKKTESLKDEKADTGKKAQTPMEKEKTHTNNQKTKSGNADKDGDKDLVPLQEKLKGNTSSEVFKGSANRDSQPVSVKDKDSDEMIIVSDGKKDYEQKAVSGKDYKNNVEVDFTQVVLGNETIVDVLEKGQKIASGSEKEVGTVLKTVQPEKSSSEVKSSVIKSEIVTEDMEVSVVKTELVKMEEV